MPVYRVEILAGYRNPLRHGIRGKTVFAVFVEAPGKIEARVAAESILLAHFAQRFGYLEVRRLDSRAATVAPAGKTAGTVEEIAVLA